jgi:DNA-binding NarL/FixJ family response regulator
MAINIVLADDHAIVLHGLQQLLDRQEDLHVVACCRDGASAIDAVRTHHPDVLVLDLRMPGESGLDVLRALGGHPDGCRTLLLTAAIQEEEAREAMRLGAVGIVLKESAPEVLIESVRRASAGERWIEHHTDHAAARLPGGSDGQTAPTRDVLTPRELDIVRMVAQGLRNRKIAEGLAISEGTVKVHLHNIYEKLGVGSRLELVLAAQQKRLI